MPQESSCSICPPRWVGRDLRCNEIGKDTGTSKAGLQVPNPTLPFDPLQEQWDRLLVLYPVSLAIFSEEPEGLSFKVGPLHIYLSRRCPLRVGVETQKPVFQGLLGQSIGLHLSGPTALVSLVSSLAQSRSLHPLNPISTCRDILNPGVGGMAQVTSWDLWCMIPL